MEKKVDFCGVAQNMPGTTGFTMAAFKAEDVPPGTRLYATGMARLERQWNAPEQVPKVPLLSAEEFIVAVHRQGIPGLPYVTSAYYANNMNIGRNANHIASGWYIRNPIGEYYPLLLVGDVLRGWMPLPEFSE
jgi:hypothetical protein